MRTLYFDLETTGVYYDRFPPYAPEQPSIVQLAAVLECDERELGVVTLIVNSGVPIPAGATAVHGISDEDVQRFGVPLKAAVGMFLRLVVQCDRLCAYNMLAFDLPVMRTAAVREGLGNKLELLLRDRELRDPVKESTERCQLPPSEKMKAFGMTGFKTPKLSEAYQQATGAEMRDAHNAAADVYALITVDRWLRRRMAA
jgi:DNA polymerase-3 subunit epsilon